MAPALCVVILIGVDQGTADAREAAGVHLIASSTAGEFAPPPPPPSAPAPTGSSSVDEPAEDVVTVPLGQQYVWPSGIGLAVPAPTIQAATARHPAAAVLVRTTVLNTSTAPYDVRAVLGPTARYDGRDVDRIADSRYTGTTLPPPLMPGQRSVYETTFPAGDGHLTLEYRVGFLFEAVVFDGPVTLSGFPS
jgi:hypothetical protein